MPVKLSGGALVYRGNGSIPFRVKNSFIPQER